MISETDDVHRAISYSLLAIGYHGEVLYDITRVEKSTEESMGWKLVDDLMKMEIHLVRYMRTNIPYQVSAKEIQAVMAQTKCYICNEDFDFE